MTERDVIDCQKEQWQRTFAENPDMYGAQPSDPGRYAIDLFGREGAHDVLELGAGQGRDTFGFLASDFHVTALDYEVDSLNVIQDKAARLGVTNRLDVVVHDVRQPLPFPEASFHGVYSHMLFNMALTTRELEMLADEVRRVLRPDGLHIYTARHVGDVHFGAGTDHGDGMFENGGFIVHFVDQPLVDRLSEGFTLVEVHEFEEGALPRKLWRITLRKLAA